MTASKWSQKHKQVAKDRKTRTWLQNPFLSEEATLSHLTYVIPFQQNKWSGVSCEWLLHFPPAPISAQSVTRIAESGTTVYDCASFVSSSRNSNRRALRSSPHARRPSIVDTSKNKSANLGKRAAWQKKDLFLTRIFPARNLFLITVLNKFQKLAAGENYSHYSFKLIPKQKGCNCNHFVEDGTAGVLSRTFIVKNISNSLTYTIPSSCVCTSPLAVRTIVGLHDFVKVSISALLKSFLLIMCIDAPESTTNSLSSGFHVDAGKHLFSEGEKNVALSCSLNLNTFLVSFHAASRAHSSCHSVSSCDRSSNFGALELRSWGSPGQTYPSEGFWSRILVWRATAFVNFTRWIGLSMLCTSGE